MARNKKRGMASRPRRKSSLLLRLALVIIIVALLWNMWADPDEDGGSEPPPMATYAEQPARNDWPPLPGSDHSFSAPVDLLKTNYYVILDGSASMGESECSSRSKMADAIDALSSFVDSVPQGANIGVSVFNDNRIIELLSLQSDTGLNTTMLSQMVPGGATLLRSAMHYSYAEMISQGERQLGYGEYHLVVISGGMATEGEDPAAVVRRMLSESPVNLYTIGFCSGADHSLDQPGFISYRAAENIEALKQGLREVLAEAPSSTLDSFQEPVNQEAIDIQ